MSNVYQKFTSRKPSCFSSFNLIECSADIASNWMQGPEFITRQIVCDCSSENLDILASSDGDQLLAPIVASCPNCQKSETLFDPRKHGWDAQEGGDCYSLVGESEPKKVNGSACTVIVNYSYQGEENYNDLLEDDVENPEDYFDVIFFHYINEKGSIKEVVSYECA